ncbi:MAG TPA: bacteriocin [Cyanobacteria bacterium UBA8530]|nr:bacteriocin [Cyanobacteria bacterium UBA8530]
MVEDLSLLNRSEAPLSEEEWNLLEKTVVQVARGQLVGRKVLDLFGPLGIGIQNVDYDVFTDRSPAVVDFFGEPEARDRLVSKRRIHSAIPLLYKDFVLFLRDLESSRRTTVPLDFTAAAASASEVAFQEDELIFKGKPELGQVGFLQADGRQVLSARNWQEVSNGFLDLVEARAKLLAAGFYGPYALVLNPLWYAALHRIFDGTGRLEIEQVRGLAEAGVFQTSVIPPDRGIVLSVGIQNFDLAVAQDLTVGYLGPENLNFPFRVFEALALRIKRPGAICVLEG